MNKRTKIVVTATAVLTTLIIAVYWYSGRKPASGITPDTNTPAKQEPMQSEVPSTAQEPSEGLIYKQIRVPAITTEEFTAPNFVKATPAHKSVAALADVSGIRLEFSAKLVSDTSRIIVFSENKLVASGGTLSVGGKILTLPLNTGAFNAKSFATGIYEVYYDACFAGDQCYKGQYAFVGVVP